METNLLLIIGKPGSGKSKFLNNYSEEKGIPILDFDKILGTELPEGKNKDYVYGFINGFLNTYTPKEILLDKKSILYKADTDIDLLQFLTELAQKKKVIATWNGYTENGKLIHSATKKQYDLNTINCQYMEIK